MQLIIYDFMLFVHENQMLATQMIQQKEALPIHGDEIYPDIKGAVIIQYSPLLWRRGQGGYNIVGQMNIS